MSHIKPLPDLTYLNSFFTKRGKKLKHNAEFQKMKLFKIIQQLKAVDPIQAQIAQAHIEFYFGDYSKGEQILENVLKLTNEESVWAWDMLIDRFIQKGDYEKVLKTFNNYQNSSAEFNNDIFKNFTHVLRVYMFTETLNKFEFQNPVDIEGVKIVNENSDKLKAMGISLDVYRVFLSKLYNTFYESFSGTIEPLLYFFENEIVIRINSTIDDAKELIELNNEYNNQIMLWYASVDNEIKEQIEKVTVYFRSKVFS
ncbi:hypothetical protein R4446_00030 [Acinetobacter baumannii]|nr:hypothetical protein [Acinetobacter baumannii]MDV7386053.1 hypothetical protein [Acinetobacter baumannii]